ncbi:hypothetical protein ACFLY2_02265 [Patescibacteria group bacterium]
MDGVKDDVLEFFTQYSPHLTSPKGRGIEQSQIENIATSLPLGETE